VREPAGDLLWALTELEGNEKWLLKPVKINNKTWTPGIKIGTKFGDKSHFEEFFGPVLTIMEFKDLDGAIRIVNSTGYGLTSGLESLDEREYDIWKDNIKAGNLYINRSTTGALVMRQPFGGMGQSSFGSGIKAGGLNYITQFVDYVIVDKKPMTTNLLEEFNKISANYSQSFAEYFDKENDYSDVLGQYNICRFVKTSHMAIRVANCDSELSILLRLFAVQLCVTSATLSVDDSMGQVVYNLKNNKNFASLFNDIIIDVECDESFANSVHIYNRVRYAGDNVSEEVMNYAADFGIYISKGEVVPYGRFELLQYLQEQSISYNYHRYGHVETK
jgi:RHH-type proline utilization regulon transcriptional repressor/proline dehydrogenase/delta 1-pyrroline-5-carboxylate dehydrogenase